MPASGVFKKRRSPRPPIRAQGRDCVHDQMPNPPPNEPEVSALQAPKLTFKSVRARAVVLKLRRRVVAHCDHNGVAADPDRPPHRGGHRRTELSRTPYDQDHALSGPGDARLRRNAQRGVRSLLSNSTISRGSRCILSVITGCRRLRSRDSIWQLGTPWRGRAEYRFACCSAAPSVR